MSVERISPLYQAQKEVVAAASKEEARIENTREGLCPVCHVAMKPATANGIAVVYCPDHSITMPVRDVEHSDVQQ